MKKSTKDHEDENPIQKRERVSEQDTTVQIQVQRQRHDTGVVENGKN